MADPRRPVLLDGGLATTLQRVGLPPGTSPTPWVATHRAEVEGAHRAFVEAGAEVLLTATLCGNARALAGAGSGGARALNAAAVEAARVAARGHPGVRVAGSIGPVAAPGRPYDPADTAASGLWADQARALGAADLLVLETFVDPLEAVAALAAVRPTFAGPVVVSLCPRDDGRLWTGDDAGPWARRLVDAGADVVGANCGTGPRGIALAVEAIRAATGAPVWAKPNAGVPATLDDDAWLAATAAIPADWLGGCCGVGPELLARLAAALR